VILYGEGCSPAARGEQSAKALLNLASRSDGRPRRTGC
jgi:hypothetical protein